MVKSWTFLISILTHLDVIIFNLVLIAKNVNEKATGVILQAGSVFAFVVFCLLPNHRLTRLLEIASHP